MTDATVVFMDRYEICGACDQTQRVADAKAVLNAYGGTPPYAAKFVSQTWPVATMPAFTVTCGQRVTAKLVLKNMGSKAWNSSTRLGTTMPRDRASIFARSDWSSPDRAAAITGTVAPGASGTFAFSFDGPTGAACVPGMYQEHFGIVQDGTAWFSDAGDGGPADDQIEALIELVPGDGSGSAGNTGSDTGSDGEGSDTGATDNHAGCNAGGGGGLVSVLVIGLVVRRRATASTPR